MGQNSLPPRVLKVGGIQAARIVDTAPLIQRLRENGPLSVILSAPNTNEFRTTNVLIEAAKVLSDGDVQKSKELLLSVQDFVLNTVCAQLHGTTVFRKIQREIQELFGKYTADIDFYAKDRSPTARFFTVPPEESNDFVASVWKKPVHGGRGGGGRLHTVVPFIELGENISALIYAHITNGIPVTSRSWMRDEISTVHQRVRESHELIIAGALRMHSRDKMLLKFGRGYTDANAGRLAVGADAQLLVHKEFPVCTADPRIVNGSSRPIPEASMDAIRATLHPLVGAQFLNKHVFADGEPRSIGVGDFSSGEVTQVSRKDIPEALPLIQKGPRVQRDSQGIVFGGTSLAVNPEGEECLVSVVDHSSQSHKRLSELRGLLGAENSVASLNDRVASVLVPCHQADDVVRRIHHSFCE